MHTGIGGPDRLSQTVRKVALPVPLQRGQLLKYFCTVVVACHVGLTCGQLRSPTVHLGPHSAAMPLKDFVILIRFPEQVQAGTGHIRIGTAAQAANAHLVSCSSDLRFFGYTVLVPVSAELLGGVQHSVQVPTSCIISGIPGLPKNLREMKDPLTFSFTTISKPSGSGAYGQGNQTRFMNDLISPVSLLESPPTGSFLTSNAYSTMFVLHFSESVQRGLGRVRITSSFSPFEPGTTYTGDDLQIGINASALIGQVTIGLSSKVLNGSRRLTHDAMNHPEENTTSRLQGRKYELIYESGAFLDLAGNGALASTQSLSTKKGYTLKVPVDKKMGEFYPTPGNLHQPTMISPYTSLLLKFNKRVRLSQLHAKVKMCYGWAELDPCLYYTEIFAEEMRFLGDEVLITPKFGLDEGYTYNISFEDSFVDFTKGETLPTFYSSSSQYQQPLEFLAGRVDCNGDGRLASSDYGDSSTCSFDSVTYEELSLDLAAFDLNKVGGDPSPLPTNSKFILFFSEAVQLVNNEGWWIVVEGAGKQENITGTVSGNELHISPNLRENTEYFIAVASGYVVSQRNRTNRWRGFGFTFYTPFAVQSVFPPINAMNVNPVTVISIRFADKITPRTARTDGRSDLEIQDVATGKVVFETNVVDPGVVRTDYGFYVQVTTLQPARTYQASFLPFSVRFQTNLEVWNFSTRAGDELSPSIVYVWPDRPMTWDEFMRGGGQPYVIFSEQVEWKRRRIPGMFTNPAVQGPRVVGLMSGRGEYGATLNSTEINNALVTIDSATLRTFLTFLGLVDEDLYGDETLRPTIDNEGTRVNFNIDGIWRRIRDLPPPLPDIAPYRGFKMNFTIAAQVLMDGPREEEMGYYRGSQVMGNENREETFSIEIIDATPKITKPTNAIPVYSGDASPVLLQFSEAIEASRNNFRIRTAPVQHQVPQLVGPVGDVLIDGNNPVFYVEFNEPVAFAFYPVDAYLVLQMTPGCKHYGQNRDNPDMVHAIGFGQMRDAVTVQGTIVLVRFPNLGSIGPFDPTDTNCRYRLTEYSSMEEDKDIPRLFRRATTDEHEVGSAINTSALGGYYKVGATAPRVLKTTLDDFECLAQGYMPNVNLTFNMPILVDNTKAMRVLRCGSGWQDCPSDKNSYNGMQQTLLWEVNAVSPSKVTADKKTQAFAEVWLGKYARRCRDLMNTCRIGEYIDLPCGILMPSGANSGAACCSCGGGEVAKEETFLDKVFATLLMKPLNKHMAQWGYGPLALNLDEGLFQGFSGRRLANTSSDMPSSGLPVRGRAARHHSHMLTTSTTTSMTSTSTTSTSTKALWSGEASIHNFSTIIAVATKYWQAEQRRFRKKQRRLNTVCRDKVPPGEAEWHDSRGADKNCMWYGSGPPDRCTDFGNLNAWKGATASQACCECGGGDTFTVDFGGSWTTNCGGPPPQTYDLAVSGGGTIVTATEGGVQAGTGTITEDVVPAHPTQSMTALHAC